MTKTFTFLVLALTLCAGCIEDAPGTDAYAFQGDAGTLEPDPPGPGPTATPVTSEEVDECASLFHVVSVASDPVDHPEDNLGSHVLWEERPCSEDPLFSRPGGRWVAAFHYGTDCPGFNPETFAGLFASYREVEGCHEYRIVRDWPESIPLPEVE